jgi:N utilization substance protein B
VYTHLIFPSELLSSILEEQSIYWNDDLEFITSMIVKTFRKFKEEDGPEKTLMQLYKNQEDREYVVKLFRLSILHREEYVEYIKQNTRNWDLERIAFMDILIMQMAIAELVGFPSIPTKVTLNEYLEISKYYSTSKSNVFINGVLDKVVLQLKEEGKVVKTGRGLIGEND